MEQRKYTRHNTEHMEVDISDRVGFSTGTIKDISRFGLCITDIPRKLQTKNDFFTVIISRNGHRYKLQVQPKWQKPDGVAMVTGVIIDNAPWSWTEMIMKLEPKNDDIWKSN